MALTARLLSAIKVVQYLVGLSMSNPNMPTIWPALFCNSRSDSLELQVSSPVPLRIMYTNLAESFSFMSLVPLSQFLSELLAMMWSVFCSEMKSKMGRLCINALLSSCLKSGVMAQSPTALLSTILLSWLYSCWSMWPVWQFYNNCFFWNSNSYCTAFLVYTLLVISGQVSMRQLWRQCSASSRLRWLSSKTISNSLGLTWNSRMRSSAL